MISFIVLLLRNLGRKRSRTLLTLSAVAILTAIFTFVTTVTDVVGRLVESHGSSTRLIVRERFVVPSRFPVRYVHDVSQLEGVTDHTIWNFYGGLLDEAGTRAVGIATRTDNLREMHPDLEGLTDEVLSELNDRRDGAIVGWRVMEQLGWQVGQSFTVRSVTHPGHDLQFTILGEMRADVWSRSFFFREDYYRDATEDYESVNLMWLRVASEADAARVAGRVDRMFANSPTRLMVESESAGVGRLTGRISSLVTIINLVVAILLTNMTIVLANSISMTVRERRQEVAIFKILGFRRGFILSLVIGESTLIGMIGGFGGAFLAYAISRLHNGNHLPFHIDFLTSFPVPVSMLVTGVGVGALVGVLGSLLPAVQAQRISVVEAFSRVA